MGAGNALAEKSGRPWERAQNEIGGIRERIRQQQEKLETELLDKIGIRLLPSAARKGIFVLNWPRLERWDTFVYRKDFIDLERQLTRLNARPLQNLVHFISRSWKDTDFPNGVFPYIEISCGTKETGITESHEINVHEAPSRV